MKKLIVNADDLGLSPEVDGSIVRAHRQGIVTASTCLVNLPALERVPEALAQAPDLDVGLHLNLTWGAPVSRDVPHLAPAGRFRDKKSLALGVLLGRIPRAEIDLEIRAQINRFRERFGAPSHVDTHQHVHVLRPVHDALVLAVQEHGASFLRFPAERCGGGPAIRWVGRAFRRRRRPSPPPRTTDHFRGLALAGRLDETHLRGLLGELPDGLTELMTHPGSAHALPGVPDRLGPGRARELEALTAPSIRDLLEKVGIELTTFRKET